MLAERRRTLAADGGGGGTPGTAAPQSNRRVVQQREDSSDEGSVGGDDDEGDSSGSQGGGQHAGVGERESDSDSEEADADEGELRFVAATTGVAADSAPSLQEDAFRRPKPATAYGDDTGEELPFNASTFVKQRRDLKDWFQACGVADLTVLEDVRTAFWQSLRVLLTKDISGAAWRSTTTSLMTRHQLQYEPAVLCGLAVFAQVDVGRDARPAQL